MNEQNYHLNSGKSPYDHKVNGSISSQRFGHPPPPPPPPPFVDGVDGSPPSAESGNVHPYSYSTNGAENGNGYFTQSIDGQVPSPIETRADKSSKRKRSYTRRDSSSNEEDTPARRQEDDVTPKLKRRQPKVAAAYR